MTVTYAQVIFLGVLLFLTGLACVGVRRNLIMILIGVEIMLNAAGIVFAGASLRWNALDGQAFVIFIMAVAAAEVAVGLALIVHCHRRSGTMDADRYNAMGG
jgi:NADH-quinone oxidoreductase subunit K